MTDPGLPPRPRRSLNLLESLVQEEEAKDKNKDLTNVKIPTSGIESSHSSDSQDNEPELDKENSANTYKEFKMKDIVKTQGVKSRPNSGFKGKKFSKRRSRSSSSERGKKKGKLVRPFSADVKQEKRNKILSESNRPKSSKGPRGRKGSRGGDKRGRARSLSSSSANSYSDDFEEEKDRKVPRDDFFDSDSAGEASKDKTYDYVYGKNKDVKETKNKKYSSDSESSNSKSSDSESSDGRKKAGTSKQVNGHVSRGTERMHGNARVVYNSDFHDKENKPGTSTQDDTHVVNTNHGNKKGTGSNGIVVVEDDSSALSSSDDESKNRENTTKVVHESKSRPRKLLRRKKVLKTNTLVIDPDKYLQAKVHQKYVELEELMSCSFIDPRKDVTRQQLYQMELLRDQYHNVSHGLASSHVIIPRSLPGDVRTKGARPQSATTHLSGTVHSSGKPTQYLDLDQDSYDRAYGTLRSVIDAEHGKVTHALRSDIIAVRAPPTGDKKKPKKKKLEPKLKHKDNHSEEEDISEKPSVRSNRSTTSGDTTPRWKDHTFGIDHHIKYTKNEKLKRWLKQKDKIYRQHIKEEKIKKREERDKLINEANDKIEKTIESQKRVKQWMHEKNKELRRRHREEMKREEAEKAARKKMEENLPGDTIKIKTHRPEDVKIDEAECKGEKTPEYVKEQIHLKREIEDENKQAKLIKQEPHPPQTKFIYKRPVAGKIKFKMQQERAKSPHGEKSDNERDERIQKGMRMSYDDWLKKKKRDDSAKRREDERQREMAKSDPELDRIIPDLAKKRIENKLNSRKRVNTGIKEYDDKANKSFGGAEFTGEKERPRSAYRLAGQTSDGPALQVKQVRPQTAPASRGKVPHPKKSVKSPRQAVIPQKADAIMSNSDATNPYKVPFPPELGVPKYVAERQRKIFADQMNQRLAEAEQQELKDKKDGENKYKETLEKLDTQVTEDNTATEIEETHQAPITSIMYSPKKREDSSESSSEDEKRKAKEQENVKVDKKNDVLAEHVEIKRTGTEPKTSEKTDISEIEGSPTNENDIKNDIAKVNLSEKKEDSDVSQDKKSSDIQASETKDVKSEEQLSLMRIKAYDNLNDIGFGPVIINNETNSDNESDSEDEHASMSNSGTNSEAEKDRETDKNKDAQERDFNGTEENVMDEQSQLVSILKESKGHQDELVPEKVDDKTFTASESKKGDIEESEDPQKSKRVSFSEQPTVYQSFESSSTDTITPEQPGEFNA